MSKTADTAKADPAKSAETSPDAVAQEAEADRLWKEMAAKHTDPNGSGAVSESQADDDTGEDDDQDEGAVTAQETTAPKAEPAAAPEKTEPQPKETTPGAEPAKADASKDASSTADDIWAKAEHDPRTKALKDAYDAAPESARPAIEAAQRRAIANGQEIARLRSERSAKKPAAAPAPAAPAAEEEPYDISKDDEWKKIKADYPDFGDAVEKLVSKAVGSVAKRTEAKIAPLEASTKAHDKALEESKLVEQGNLLVQLHPDYTAAISTKGFSDAFAGWLDSQPDAIRDMAERNSKVVVNANEASFLFRSFKADTGFMGAGAAKPAPSTVEDRGAANPKPNPARETRRRQQLDGSVSIANRGPAKTGEGDPNDADYWWKVHSERKARELAAETMH